MVNSLLVVFFALRLRSIQLTLDGSKFGTCFLIHPVNLKEIFIDIVKTRFSPSETAYFGRILFMSINGIFNRAEIYLNSHFQCKIWPLNRIQLSELRENSWPYNDKFKN